MQPIESRAEPNVSSTVVRSIAESIRQLIVTSELLPGEQLRQADLAARLNVSRIPIREALSILIAEHLVVHHPQRGFFVNKINDDTFRQLRLIRNLLESSALRQMSWPSQAEIDEIERLSEEIHELGKSGNILKMRELNSKFHDVILGYSRLQVVVGEINRFRLFADLYRNLFVWDEAKLERSHREHQQIIAALRARDSEALVAARNQHAAAFDDEIVSRLHSAPKPHTSAVGSEAEHHADA